MNVAEIDQQHQKLVNLINELNDSMKPGTENVFWGKIIDELAKYAVFHFQTEEKYFDQFQYPDRHNHIKEHTAFIKAIGDFSERIEQGELSVTEEMMEYLQNWLKHHIMGSDQKYSHFFKDKGLK